MIDGNINMTVIIFALIGQLQFVRVLMVLLSIVIVSILGLIESNWNTSTNLYTLAAHVLQ